MQLFNYLNYLNIGTKIEVFLQFLFSNSPSVYFFPKCEITLKNNRFEFGFSSNLVFKRPIRTRTRNLDLARRFPEFFLFPPLSVFRVRDRRSLLAWSGPRKHSERFGCNSHIGQLNATTSALSLHLHISFIC